MKTNSESTIKPKSYKTTGISYEEKKLVVVKSVNNDGTYDAYDGKKHFKLTAKEREQILRNPVSSEYKLIPYDEAKKTTIEGYFKHITNCAYDLQKHTSDKYWKINMYKTGKFSTTSLQLFYTLLNKQNKKKPEEAIIAEDVDMYEARFLNKVCGGLVYTREYTGKLHKYDINSFYPSIMRSGHLMVPIKKGILKTMTSDDFNKLKFFPIGIYRCNIEKKTGLKYSFFKINPEGYYTNTDLNVAKDLGLKMSIIEEDNNVLLYPRNHCVTGTQLFGSYVDKVYKLKSKKITGSKDILNTLWGALTQAWKYVRIIDNDNPQKDNEFVLEARLLDEEDQRYEIDYNDDNKEKKPFRTPFARLKPFLMSKGREILFKTIIENYKNVYYCRVDSIVSSVPLDLNFDKKIGSWRYEGCTDDTGFIKENGKKSSNDDFVI
jgi:hypothetical protein